MFNQKMSHLLSQTRKLNSLKSTGKGFGATKDVLEKLILLKI